MLGILAGCALGPVVGAPELKEYFAAGVPRELAWLGGLLPLAAVVGLFALELRRDRLAGRTAPVRLFAAHRAGQTGHALVRDVGGWGLLAATELERI